MTSIPDTNDARRSCATGKKTLIYFSSVPYYSYTQRPHFMAMAFADAGYDAVLWIDPYMTRLPRPSDARRRRGKTPSRTGSDPRIECHRPMALPIEPLPLGSLVNHVLCWSPTRRRLLEFATGSHCVIGVGRPSDLALWALGHLPHERSFVDVLDNFPAFYHGLSRLSMRRRLRKVCQLVTDVFCSSSQLARDIREIRRDAVVVLNGYPTDHLPPPSILPARRCIGYLGTIGEWFDWPLVCEIAKALPDIQVRLIGPEFVPRPVELPANIALLGERPFDEMKNLARDFAVGLIPFKHNDLTECVDPIKFYEYRSMGIPIWSTLFGEMRLRGHADGVTTIARGSNWPSLWDQARTAKIEMRAIAAFKEAVSWEKRFAPVLERLAWPRQIYTETSSTTVRAGPSHS